jgi:tRNA dimethylallyltransferase
VSRITQKPIFAIVGPTASGKSALGIELAHRFNGEIINCDSVQVYQRIEIATAKVSSEEQRGVPHHLIDFVPPDMTYTAGLWARDAARAIEEIEARGRTIFIVGGTGFYLRALREPLFESAPTDENLRRRLIAIRQRRGAEHLYRLLARLDPASAARLAPRDWSRVQRALEVRLQTGKTISEHQRAQTDAPTIYGARLRLFALAPPRAALYARINERTRAHFRAGLVEEVERLLREGVPADSNALGAHGYRRVVEFLCGARTLESAIEQTQTDVRRYAKRQMTWFRREPNVEWFEGFGDDPTIQARIAACVRAELNKVQRL